ncbi:MAG: hypothetical protein IJH12_05740 [Clostridia bacterium]|nr:hypothetical protein [Clostridia bacterium]
MNERDLYNYSPEKEYVGGIYWQFLEMSKDSIDELGVDIVYFSKITRIIQNAELRTKMKLKFCELVKDKSIYSLEEVLERGEYTQNEKDKAYEEKLERILYESKHELEDIEKLVVYISHVSDNGWRAEFIKKIAQITEQWFDDRASEYQIRDSWKNYKKLGLIKRCKNVEDAQAFLEIWESTFSNYDRAIAKVFMNKHYIKDKQCKYKEKDVLIGINPDIQIGLEIELNNKDGRGVDIVDNQEGFEEWQSQRDVTVPDGNEFSSPVLHDTIEDMSALKALFDTLRDVGYYAEKSNDYNTNTSGQVNIGLDYLDSAEAIVCFFELYGNVEEVLYHICNPNGEFIRQDIFASSRFKPVSPLLGKRIISEDLTREEAIELFASERDGGNNHDMMYKKMSVCIRDGDSKFGRARLEFRMSNGSDDFEVWKQNIKLYAKLVELSKEISSIRQKSEITAGEELKLLLFEELKDEENTLEDKLNILMDLLFKNEVDKEIYIDRFYELEQTMKQKPTQRYTRLYDNDGFFEVADFERLHKPNNHVVAYDPETEVYSEYEDNDDR